jgi:flagellar biosynthesis/type III secretory pathway protein FliH
MSPSVSTRIIPAHIAETKEVEAFPYFAATFTAPLAVDDGSMEGDQPLSAEISSPEEDAKRLASVDQIIYDKLQQADREAHDIARRAYEEGFEAGEVEGRTFGESQYRSYIQRLETHLSELAQAAALLSQATEEELIALALSFGEYLAAQQIDQAQQTIRPLLNSVLESHPFNAPDTADNAALTIFLNPKDLEQLGDAYIGMPGIALREDLELSRGSLRIEAEEGVLEATLERRRDRLMQAIHRAREKGNS